MATKDEQDSERKKLVERVRRRDMRVDVGCCTGRNGGEKNKLDVSKRRLMAYSVNRTARIQEQRCTEQWSRDQAW